MRYAVHFIAVFIVCLLVTEFLKRILSKTRLATVKERPMLLGVSVYATVLIYLLLMGFLHSRTNVFIIRILVGSFLIVLLGIVDDVKKLTPGLKLSGQLAVAFIMIILGVRTTIYYFPIWMNSLLTIIWIVVLINAFNLLDIMDGLCTGVSFIVAVSFFVASLVAHSIEGTIFFCILAGTLFAALLRNLPPAKMYLGDSGSMLLGFIFSISALHVSYAPNFSEGLSLFAPLLIVGLPLYDLTFTIIARKTKGLPITKKSSDHLVFIMQGLGMEVKKILFVIYGACILFSTSAVALKMLPTAVKPWFLAIIIVLLASATIKLNIIESKKLKR